MRGTWVLGLLGLLVACSGGDDGGGVPGNPRGTLSGTLTPFRTGASAPGRALRPGLALGPRVAARMSAAAARLAPRPPAALPAGLPLLASPGSPAPPRAPAGAQVIPGQVVVRLAQGDAPLRQGAAPPRVPGMRARQRARASAHHQLVEYIHESGRPLGAEETRTLARQVAALPGVAWAEPNLRVGVLKVPDDPGYSFQWHYAKMNLPSAWELEDGTGSPEMVVAVIDSGIVAHPELAERVLPGYDFISDPAQAADGDGRDADPRDPGGDQPDGSSSYHGSHVAGTIGAATNNGRGVAGVHWNVRILPVRALGRLGAGSSLDIAAAIRWAAGRPVDGVPPNPFPARVINLSLGGQAPPQQVFQDAIDEVTTLAGAIVVVAAGNENQDAANVTPCNQRNVICVGGTRFNGLRASYSNFGAAVDVMAPGGELREDLNGDGRPDGVLSTVLDGEGVPAYIFYNGTSMAAPHVAGLVALMVAAEPALGLVDVEQVLRDTADPTFVCPEGCGAGLVNALSALAELEEAVDPSTPASLSVPTTELLLRGAAGTVATATLAVSNVGGQPMSVSATPSGAAATRVSVQPATLTVPPRRSGIFTLSADLSGLAPGQDVLAVLDLVATSEGSGEGAGSARIGLTLRATEALPDRDAVLGFAYQDAAGEIQVDDDAVFLVPAAGGYRYQVQLVPRTYFALAAIDDDGDGELFEDGERMGFWRNLDAVEEIPLPAGGTVRDISFDLVPVVGIDDTPALDVGGACSGSSECIGGVCLGLPQGFPGGYCTQECTSAPCPAGSQCYVFTPADEVAERTLCLASCTTPGTQAECRAGYVCTAAGSSNACFPP